MKLNEKIYACRKKAGLSQEALAERIGVSRQAISKWETGEAAPEISKLPLLARVFGVTADWLLDDAAEPEEPIPDEEPVPEPESRRMYSDTPVRAYPEWVDKMPRWIGGMIKRYGWLYGVRTAISGGGALAILVTILLRRVLNKDRLWVAGCLGAMAHSVGQMAVAILVSGTPGLVIYLPVMLGCSILSGGFTGLCAQVLVNRGKDLWKTSSK